jgi:3-methyl-2-oxobutanoate hydroxymethyltransferase
MSKVTTATFREKKASGKKITMLTAYDFPTARLVDEAGIDSILVGDSLGMVVLGYETTLAVTMEDMLHHTKAVTRAAKRALVVADMPFLSYHHSPSQALTNAGRFIQEAGAQAVKLEGGRERAETVRFLVEAGIPVVGHIGLTPQLILQFGGFKVQGKEEAAARKLIDDAISLADAGAFAIVLECVPVALAREITASVSIPTIGIGAGPDCDGQVLVINDLLGLYGGHCPKFVKQYAQLSQHIEMALKQFQADVESGAFPEQKHCYGV